METRRRRRHEGFVFRRPGIGNRRRPLDRASGPFCLFGNGFIVSCFDQIFPSDGSNQILIISHWVGMDLSKLTGRRSVESLGAILFDRVQYVRVRYDLRPGDDLIPYCYAPRDVRNHQFPDALEGRDSVFLVCRMGEPIWAN